jgi:hypothetical protein
MFKKKTIGKNTVYLSNDKVNAGSGQFCYETGLYLNGRRIAAGSGKRNHLMLARFDNTDFTVYPFWIASETN